MEDACDMKLSSDAFDRPFGPRRFLADIALPLGLGVHWRTPVGHAQPETAYWLELWGTQVQRRRGALERSFGKVSDTLAHFSSIELRLPCRRFGDLAHFSLSWLLSCFQGAETGLLLVLRSGPSPGHIHSLALTGSR